MFASAAFAGTSAVAVSSQCMIGLVPALKAGGYSGSTDCERDNLVVNYVGQVQQFGRTFSTYANRYTLRPICIECAIHGGQRIIFMERGEYLGQYRADFSGASIRDGRLFLRAHWPHSNPIEVKFPAKGPLSTMAR